MSEQSLERPQSGASAEAICYHYDGGTEFYRLWLDHKLTYSAARWGDPCRIAAGPVSLELAQDAKLDFHLKALGIGRGDSLLDIGCGWGSMLRRGACPSSANVQASDGDEVFSDVAGMAARIT
jgi:cyclopropane-fatty-acyl-phospholipid synthase